MRATYFDDWFRIERMDESTFAIREPRYWQHNINFLILGTERAVLFDSGPGERDITPVLRELTSLPVTVVCSHTHFDHIGNHHRFDRVAMLDLPVHRRRMRSGTYRTSRALSLGALPRRFRVTDWWAPGQTIDLGGRQVRILYTPGHTQDSCMLYDEARGQLFVGDFIYPDEIVAFTPGADVPTYLESTQRLQAECPGAKELLCAHAAPRMHGSALAQLERAFRAILEGTAPFSRQRMFVWRVRRYAFGDFAILTRATPASPERAAAALLP